MFNRLLPLAAFILAFTAPATARWASPVPTPVDRLVRNLSTYAAAHPDDPQAYYLLGRVHGLAFVLQSNTVGVWRGLPDDPDVLPRVADRSFQHHQSSIDAIYWRPGKAPIAPPTDVTMSLQHLEASIRAFERALVLDESNAAAHLGYAYILDRASHLVMHITFVPGRPDAPKLDVDVIGRTRAAIESVARKRAWRLDGSAEAWLAEHRADVMHEIMRYRAAPDRAIYDVARAQLERYWLDRAARHYLRAHELGFGTDQDIDEQPMRGLTSLVSYESGQSFLRILESIENADGALSTERLAQRDHVQVNLAVLDAKPHNNAITPIILAVDQRRSLSDMLAPEVTVDFDLDGDGAIERWPWIRPDVGFLVWDQRGTGRITSGQQLFGSATWWMFFDDGYRALAALDDDGDGWIRGAERRYLSVWFDRNSNGVSDDGEVTPLTALGIAALRARATGTEDGCPAAHDGVEFDDGTRLPTYDWITKPVVNR